MPEGEASEHVSSFHAFTPSGVSRGCGILPAIRTASAIPAGSPVKGDVGIARLSSVNARTRSTEVFDLLLLAGRVHCMRPGRKNETICY